MEILTAPSTSLDPTGRTDNGSPDKDTEPSGEFAALLFSALVNFNFNDIPAQAGEAGETVLVAASERDPAMAPLAQEDRPVANASAGDSVPGSFVPEKALLAASTQAARPQNGAASDEIEASSAENPQITGHHPEAYGSEPALVAPTENSKKAGRDAAAIDQNSQQVTSVSLEQPAEATITNSAGADAIMPLFQRRANIDGASSLPPDQQPSTPPNDAILQKPTAQGQSVARGQVSTAEKNLGQMVSAMAHDHEDGVTPGLRLGQELQTAKAGGQEGTQETPRLSSAQPVDSQPGERQLQAGDGHDHPPGQRQEEAPAQPLRDSAAMAGAPMARGYEMQQDSEPLSKWRPTVERLADDIVRHARLGRTEAVLQLDPPELGKVKIALRLEDGKLRARIIAEGHDSKQLIEAHLPELRQALAAGRLEVIDLRVSQGNGSGLSGDLSQSFHRAPQGQPESNFNSFHPLPPTRSEPPPGQRQTRREAGRVSLWA